MWKGTGFYEREKVPLSLCPLLQDEIFRMNPTRGEEMEN
jgi:hypothetical protein